MDNFSGYDRFVISDIARNIVSPSPIQKVLDYTGRPLKFTMNKLDSKLLRKAKSTIDSAIESGLRKSIYLGNKLTSDDAVRKEYVKLHKTSISDMEEIRLLSLRQSDTVADTFSTSNGAFVVTEGAVMGILTTISVGIFAPLTIALDVTASMTLLSRHVVQIAASYGYSASDPMNIPHILASMVPLSDSSDEGFLMLKLAAAEELKASQLFVRGMAEKVSFEAVEKACPNLINLIHKIAERLGLVLTQKELGMIIPGLGAVINASINLAFQRMNHTNAKDYFRKMYLVNKYGEEVVNEAITRDINVLKNRAS